MKATGKVVIVLLNTLIILINSCSNSTPVLPPSLSLIQGDINGVVITSDNNRLVIYGDPKNNLNDIDLVLFTHARRDVTWAGESLVMKGAKAIAPTAELAYFTQTDSVWNSFKENQFHNYSQKSTRVPINNFDVYQSVKGGDTIHWQDLKIRVIDSRGYTEGAISYFLHIDDMDIAFVGDLIYGDGQIMDIYSMQDEIAELNVWGYHGYAARMADLIHSLKKISELKPDIIIPAHGPIITDPELAINMLIHRLQLLYRNYLSINSLKWYTSQGWGNNKEVHSQIASRVLSQEMTVDWMTPAETGINPSWLIHTVNSKLILSEDGSGFLVDCGTQKVFDDLMNLEDKFSCTGIEGIFITHYHDDHTNFINQIQEKYNCPVYAMQELKDILNHPNAYKLPAMTTQAIDSLTIVAEASSISWKEFTFTFYYMPGQTIYHNAMLVEHENGEKIFLIGDSFSPTGLDDYCLQNRNFIQPGMGYMYCLNLLKKMPENYWLVNNHIEPPFKFTHKQLDFMMDNLVERKALLQDLFPWDDPNYGIDERWARIYPYSQEIEVGKSAIFSVIITNHSDYIQEYTIHPQSGSLNSYPDEIVIKVNPKEEANANFTLEIPVDISIGNFVITADIAFSDWNLHEWCESILEIQPKIDTLADKIVEKEYDPNFNI